MRDDRWEPVIGLEVHVQLATESKAFSTSAVQFGSEPNSLTDPTVLGLPGALPVFNRRALEHAIALGLATGSRILRLSRFARKHYFYPDLPKGYQISQFDEPICLGGAIEFLLEDSIRSVRLTRIHLEEDAGKSIHQSVNNSWVDLNRAGVPLCEVVSEPDIRSAEEAAAYMRALRQLVRYLGISDGDMEKGQLRCDANVSVRMRGAVEYGTRTELKNINSFRFVQNAIEHEIARQIRILDSGGQIHQETRLWDSDSGVSRAMRSKEEANDYRYLPDPDLPVITVSDELLDGIRTRLPELPMAKCRRYLESYGLSASDAHTLIGERGLAEFFDAAVVALPGSSGAAGAKSIANWILSELLRLLNRDSRTVAECSIAPEHLAQLTELIAIGTISGKIAKDVFAEMYLSGEEPGSVVERKGLRQINDADALSATARDIIDRHPQQAAEYRAGKHKLLGFFVGQMMRATRGKANPGLVNDLLRQLLHD